MPDLRTVSRSEFVRHCHPDRTPVSTPAALGLFSDPPASIRSLWILAARSTAPHDTIGSASGTAWDHCSCKSPRRQPPGLFTSAPVAETKGSSLWTARLGVCGGWIVPFDSHPKRQQIRQFEKNGKPSFSCNAGDVHRLCRRIRIPVSGSRRQRRGQPGCAWKRRAMARGRPRGMWNGRLILASLPRRVLVPD